MTAVVSWSSAADDDEPVDVEVVEEKVSLEKAEPEDDEDDYELEEVVEQPTSKARELALSVARPLPTPRVLLARTRWWTRVATQILPWLPVMLLRELRPILRGLGRIVVGWASWVQCTELAEAIKEAKENERSKATERYTKRKSARLWGSLITFVVFAGGMTWLYFAVEGAFWLAVILLVVVFDCVGRRGMGNVDNPIPFAMPTVLSEGVPLTQITKAIIETFHREGFEEGTVQVAAPLAWDADRKEYRIRVKTADEIRTEHVDALERSLGTKDGAIRNLATGTASIRELVIRVGDPLAQVPPPPFVETGSLSIKQPLDLGESSGDRSFAVKFAGLHTSITGKTGSGKTKGMLYAIIDRLSACSDVVIWGCDLQMGPAFPMWRGVIQKTAYTLDEAEQMLAAAQVEIDRRMKVLQAIAEDDDPDNDTDEWHSGLGPALVIIIDEFAVFAANNGKNGTPDFMRPLEQIIRTGRKVWTTLILATQKAGNSDFGSTVISSQTANKIMLACENDDTVTVLSKALRDQGWLPHLFAPAEDDDPKEAGKAYVYTPTHRTPDIYRAYAPMSSRDVKALARRRIADGLPTLDGRRHESIDAVEVPAILAAVERVFADAGDPERMPTVELISALRKAGFEFTGDETRAAAQLAEQLRPHKLRPLENRWRQEPYPNAVRGYSLDDVRSVIRGLS